jgi:beta-lactam-binding protein with PASTA domain
VVGLGQAAATGSLVSNGFSTQIDRQRSSEPRGTVIRQDPGAGAELESGGVVTLIVSSEPGARELAEQPAGPVEVPDVVGRQQVLAGAALERMGLVPNTRMVQRGSECCVVVAQRPRPGTTLQAGDSVELSVALAAGADRLDIPVPDLEGLTASFARSWARELGFTMRTRERKAPSSDLAGKVLEQSPPPASMVPELTRIDLVVGR